MLVLVVGVVGVILLILKLRQLLRSESITRLRAGAKVAVIGGGSAGCATAYSLSKSTDYKVTVFESCSVLGGVATSESINDTGTTCNDGVQGGSRTYGNTLALHRKIGGFEPTPVALKVSFGQGDRAWDNISKDPTPMLKRLQPEIKSFIKLMQHVQRLAWTNCYMLISISQLLTLLGYSEDFKNYMVYSLTALFFGTGNQTANVPAAVVARVFQDPHFQIFELHEELFLSGSAKNFFAFPSLKKIYLAMGKTLEEQGVEIRLNAAVKSVRRPDAQSVIIDGEQFDAVVFACDAHTARDLIQEDGGRFEKWVLGQVQYFHDLTITHRDAKYMKEHFAAEDDSLQYFIRTYKEDPALAEMGFNLSNYQPTVAGLDKPVYQTIFLNQSEHEHMWTKDRIDPSTIVLQKWWKQFAHTVSHFLKVVPFIRFLERPESRRTLYAGSWTMVNTHEAATLSGFAAAYRLGAEYPFEAEAAKGEDMRFAKEQFQDYLRLIHGV